MARNFILDVAAADSETALRAINITSYMTRYARGTQLLLRAPSQE